MTKIVAVGKRTDDGITVSSVDTRIPFLEQWVRDYVDKRKVTDGMNVLIADVDLDITEVKKLTINTECASNRAFKEDEKVDTISVQEF